MWKFLFFAGLIGLCVCDVSLNAPYAASGYRPSPASLALPGEYGAPPLPATSVQVSEETVQFAGQTVEVNSQRPHNAYLPPANQFEQLKSPRVRLKIFLSKSIIRIIFIIFSIEIKE